jgi:isoquinoline 1-oxidoreductase beta subunit
MRVVLDMPAASLTRREFLLSATLAGGCLLIGSVPRGAGAAEEAVPALGDFGPFVRIAPDGAVTVVSKHVEFGQGAQSGLAAIVAEELDADWDRMQVVAAPADLKRYAHSGLKVLQITGGSSSISNSWLQLRHAGAGARAMFVAAAARVWSVPPAEITVANGIVAHASSGHSAGFGELLAEAARETPPAEPQLKDPARFTLLGTERVRRLDTLDKTTGATRFTIDMHLPGMLTALVAYPPRFGGRVKSFDATAAKALPGVVDVFAIPSGVAVAANGFHAAKLGRDALRVEWDDSQAEMRSSADIHAEYRDIAAGGKAAAWTPFEQRGDALAELARPGKTIEFTYDQPYVAHATMEPMDCVAQVDGARCRLSHGAQSPTVDQMNAAKIVGCRPDEVEIETLPAGGSFGRRSAASCDYVKDAVHIAQHIGGFRPVKLVRTREDDMGCGNYRALTHHLLRIRVGADGYPTAWVHRLVSASLTAGTVLERGPAAGGVEGTVVEGVQGSPYFRAIPAVHAEVSYPRSIVPVTWLRSVGAAHTAMVMEHSIDRLAWRAKIDPVVYRRTLYRRADATKPLAVLELAAQKAGWGKPLERGWARGLAVHECFGTAVANIAEVALVDGQPKVRRVVCAVHCGFAVSPDQVRAQMEGGINYGLSYYLYGEVRLDHGLVHSRNFDTYRVLRMDEAPQIEVHIVPSAVAPTGTGEPGTPVIGPAIANALITLTGRATTSLPFVKA